MQEKNITQNVLTDIKNNKKNQNNVNGKKIDSIDEITDFKCRYVLS